DDWSIIPLKTEREAWRFPNPSKVIDAYWRFVAAVPTRPGPRLLGYSLNWMGRTDEEVARYLNEGRPMTPRGHCGVVDLVRYYTPRDGMVFPCNCVPHRSEGITFGEEWSRDSVSGDTISPGANWLRKNGPSHCTGCEPANAALGEGDQDIDMDPFLF